MLHDPHPSLPLDSTRRPLTSDHKQEVMPERARKGAEGFGSPGQLSTHPEGAMILFFSCYLTLSRHFSPSVGRQPKQRSGVQKG